jgi:hypothetical protein
MIVEELIDELRAMPRGAEVRVMEESGCLEHPIINVVQESGEVRIEFRDTEE